VHRALETLDAVTGGDLLETLPANVEGGKLRTQIPDPLVRCPRVQDNEIDDILPETTLVAQLHWRKPETILKDARVVAGLAARRPTSDVGMVGEIREEPGDPAVVDDRRHDRDVVEVRPPAHEGIVPDEDIAGHDTVRGDARSDRLHHATQGAEVKRRGRR
jgi:hypothetical protein